MIENITDRFSNILEARQKELHNKGLYPSSIIWPMAKLLTMLEIAKELKANIEMSDKTDRRIIRLAKLFRLDIKKIIKINNLLRLKRLFRRYHSLHGFKIWVKRHDKMNDILENYKCLTVYEPETTKIIEANVGPRQTCVDVGASIGYFTLLFSRIVGSKGRVIAIEPTDFQQPYLRKNIKKNGYGDRVVQVHCGAWDKTEILKMPLSAPAYCQFELQCRPIDDILEDLRILEVDFIKIDVDGPEPKVLKGLIRTIERSPNMKMIIEFYPKYIENGGCSVKEFQDLLDKYFTHTVIPSDYTEGCWNLFCTRK
mgnify:FL=1